LDYYSSDEIQLTVNSESDALLIVTNNYSHFWTATVDDDPQDVYPVDFTFQCVWVPSGQRIVKFIYSR